MKVSVIGSGNMGSAFVGQLTKSGHQVSVFSRDPVKAKSTAEQYGAVAVGASQVADADVIILATSAPDAAAALSGAGNLDGKVVVDITNPLTADYMGLTIGHSTSSAEEIAKSHPEVRLVKGFNTVFAQLLGSGITRQDGKTVTVFVASDDAPAKATVTELATSMGFSVSDAGPLRNARYLEPLAGLNIYFGYGAGRGTAISPTWVESV